MLFKIFIGGFILNIISEIAFIISFILLEPYYDNPALRSYRLRKFWTFFAISIILTIINSILACYIDLKLLIISTLPISIPVILILISIVISIIVSLIGALILKFKKKKHTKIRKRSEV